MTIRVNIARITNNNARSVLAATVWKPLALVIGGIGVFCMEVDIDSLGPLDWGVEGQFRGHWCVWLEAALCIFVLGFLVHQGCFRAGLCGRC